MGLEHKLERDGDGSACEGNSLGLRSIRTEAVYGLFVDYCEKQLENENANITLV